MAVAENIGIKGKEFLNRLHPCCRIAIIVFQERRPDVLREEDPRAVDINVKGD